MRLALCVLVFLIVGCSGNRVVLTVGTRTITASDIRRRDEVVRLYYPAEKRLVGETQLLRANQLAAILDAHGMPVDDAVLAKEDERIRTTTLAPEKLARIRDVFDGDVAAYRRVYVLPVYVERVAYYDLFLQRPEFHRATFDGARELLEVVRKSPAKFQQIAKRRGASPVTVSATAAGIRPIDEPKGAPPPSSVPENVRRQLAGKTDGTLEWVEKLPGDGTPGLVVLPDAVLVARVQSKRGDATVLDVVGFPKQDFAPWFEAQAAKISVERR